MHNMDQMRHETLQCHLRAHKMNANDMGWWEKKGDVMEVESNCSEQMESVCQTLGACVTITSSPHNCSKGASSRHDSANANSAYKKSKASSMALASSLEISPIFNPVYWAKGRGEASEDKSLILVSIGVLKKGWSSKWQWSQGRVKRFL